MSIIQVVLLYFKRVCVCLPDGVSGADAVDPAVLVQDDVGLQVSVVVVSGEVVCDDPRRDAQTAQD